MNDRITESKVKDSFKWFGDKLKNLFKKDTKTEPEKKKSLDIDSMKDFTKKMSFFNMYFFAYPDPKYKDELPYFDKLPLIFPIDVVGSKHGSGPKLRALNIHYLHPTARAVLLDEIMRIVDVGMERLGYDPDIDGYNAVAYNNLTKWVGKYMNKVYLGLEGYVGTKKLRLCYRSYLLDRIGSQIKRIKTSEWENAVNLITPDFQKASAQAIYADINNKYNKYKNNNWREIW